MDKGQEGRAALKRSKWDRGEEGQGDELEREAVEARAKAAAKAARQRAKASQRARREEEQQQQQQGQELGAGPSSVVTATSSSGDQSTPLRQHDEGHSRRTLAPRSRPPPVPPRSWHPPIQGCRSIHNYERLNHIEEGSYGVVFRAREKATGEIVALKKLKMDKEKNGFPITSLREIRSLMEAGHENVVRVREIVVGDTLTQ